MQAGKIRRKSEKFLLLGEKLVKKIKLSKEELDEIKFLDAENRKLLEEEIKEGKIKAYVGGELSCLDDDVIVKCDMCGADVAIRPWAKELIDKYGIPVKCIKCAGGVKEVEKLGFRQLTEMLSKIIKPL